MQFRAAAYDADGGAIPGVTFAWSLTNQRQGGSSLGRIDNTGMVTATGEGGIWVWATYTYSETFPGLQRQWVRLDQYGDGLLPIKHGSNGAPVHWVRCRAPR